MLTPPVLQALDACGALKEEERRRTAALEESIAGLREAQAGRDMRRAESALRPVPRPQGPLQLTGGPGYATIVMQACSDACHGAPSTRLPRRASLCQTCGL